MTRFKSIIALCLVLSTLSAPRAFATGLSSGYARHPVCRRYVALREALGWSHPATTGQNAVYIGEVGVVGAGVGIAQIRGTILGTSYLRIGIGVSLAGMVALIGTMLLSGTDRESAYAADPRVLFGDYGDSDDAACRFILSSERVSAAIDARYAQLEQDRRHVLKADDARVHDGKRELAAAPAPVAAPRPVLGSAGSVR